MDHATAKEMTMRLLQSLCVVTLGAFASAAYGQSYPAKPVKLVVPFTAGSATDILARTVGQQLTELWGQSVIVENRAGAGGTIGAGVVAKSPPDGYTLLVHSAAHAYNPSIYPELSRSEERRVGKECRSRWSQE